METLQLFAMLSVGIGCLLGVLRFVLDDKWNVLPKTLCRFCLTFWVSCFIHWIVAGWLLYFDYPHLDTCIGLITGIAVATAVSAFSYVYIKNAN